MPMVRRSRKRDVTACSTYIDACDQSDNVVLSLQIHGRLVLSVNVCTILSLNPKVNILSFKMAKDAPWVDEHQAGQDSL